MSIPNLTTDPELTNYKELVCASNVSISHFLEQATTVHLGVRHVVISCDKVQFWFLDWMERHTLAREVTYVLPVKSFAIRTKILDRQEEVFLITRLFSSEPLDA